MKQLAFFIDVNKCIYCKSCTFACWNENETNNVRRRKVVKIKQSHSHDDIHFSTSCNHCETPACMTVCPQNCIKKLKNGIVILDKNKCDGCGKCASVCPFQAITIDTSSKKADKCDMCYSRLQKNEQPICIESCIAEAISIRNIYDDYPSEYKPSFEEYKMKKITNPSTRYKYERQSKIRIFADESEY